MSLLELKNYLKKVKIASLSNLSQCFNVDSDLLRQMLAHWIQKGCIRQCTKKPACGSACFKCPAAEIEIYEWIPHPNPLPQ